MNRKAMLIPILALLLLSVPAAIAVKVHCEGEGTYSQTVNFGEVRYSFTLTGKWILDSDWGDGSHPYIHNNVTLFEGSTYESIIYPANDTSLDVLVVIEYGVQRTHDAADIQVRDYSFDATTFQDGVVPFRAWEGGSAGRNGLETKGNIKIE